MTQLEDIRARLIRIEEKMTNHLWHHSRVLTPMLIGVILLIIGLYLKRG